MSKIIIAEQTHKWVERCEELQKENKNLKKLLSKLFTTADISYCDDDFLQKILNAVYKDGASR